MAELPAPIESNSIDLPIPSETSYMFVSSCDLYNVEIIEEVNLTGRVPLLGVTYYLKARLLT